MKKFTQHLIAWLIAIEFAIEVLHSTKSKIHAPVGIRWSDHPSYSLERSLIDANGFFKDAQYRYPEFTIEEIGNLEESVKSILTGFRSIRSNGFLPFDDDQANAYYHLCDFPSTRMRQFFESIRFDDLVNSCDGDLIWLEDNQSKIAQVERSMVDTEAPSIEDTSRMIEVFEGISKEIPNLRDAIRSRDFAKSIIGQLERLIDAISKFKGNDYPFMINGDNRLIIDAKDDLKTSIAGFYSMVNPSDAMVDLLLDLREGYSPSKEFAQALIRAYFHEDHHHRVFRMINSAQIMIEEYSPGYSLFDQSLIFSEFRESLGKFLLTDQVQFPNGDGMIGVTIKDIGRIVESMDARSRLMGVVQPALDSLEVDSTSKNIAHSHLLDSLNRFIDDSAKIDDRYTKEARNFAIDLRIIAQSESSKSVRLNIDELRDRISALNGLIDCDDRDDALDQLDRSIDDFIAIEDLRASLEVERMNIDQSRSLKTLTSIRSSIVESLEGYSTSIGYQFAISEDLTLVDDLIDFFKVPSIKSIRSEKSRLNPSMVD